MRYARFYPRTAACESATWNPAADIIENKDGYTVNIDLPGFSKKDLSVQVKNGTLTVNGERERTGVEADFYHRFERPSGAFARSFRLPDFIDESSIQGSYENGVLSLDLHKREEAKPHTIAVT